MSAYFYAKARKKIQAISWLQFQKKMFSLTHSLHDQPDWRAENNNSFRFSTF